MCCITTTVTTYPTSAGRFYACNPEVITGPRIGSATPTFTADTATIVYWVNLGTAIPPIGTIMVVHRWGTMVFPMRWLAHISPRITRETVRPDPGPSCDRLPGTFRT